MSPPDIKAGGNAKYLHVMKPLVSETFKRTLLSKRSIVMLLFLCIPLILSIIYYFKGEGDGPLADFAGFFDVLYLHLLIPLVTLILSIDMFHSDFKKRTISYILIRPIPRFILYVSRFIGLVLAELVIICVPVLITFFIMMARSSSLNYWDELSGFILMIAIAILVYSSLFTFLGINFKHPLLPGLGIAFFWETIVSNLGKTVPRLTAMYYIRSIGHHSIDVEPFKNLSDQVSILTAIITLSIMFLIFCGIGIWSLYRKQLY